ncbi:diguanylate cyclase domain-containing protein [Vibrio harveyi]|uniref:transporter substrate-binding domain-containing diguanylate cyclase n=1 Tax=Vibrio harveyi TaxID=669 RepID=UPI0009385150|nr:sensor domain-containing diguanylate cyclase [Vibrio harveyi]APP08071.1 sensor domain-containing diguanylate cyclase [Vibrio harveyi]
MTFMRYSTNDWKNTIFGMFLLLIVAFHSSAVYGHETKQGTLVVANSKAWKPFSYLTPDGEPQGILIDFWREYSVRNDVHVKFLLLDWEESLLAVKEGRADIHAGLIFSAERSQYLNFGTVIMPIDTQLYVNSDLLGIDVESVLKGESAMEVGLVKGGYEETFVRKHYPNAAIRLFSNNDALLKAVTNKQIFLFVADTQVSNFYMATTPDSVTFLPALHLYSKDLRIATGDGSAKSIEEVSRNFEIVMEANKDRILSRWIHVKTVYPAYLAPLAVFALIIAAMFHIFSLKRTVALRTRQLTLVNQQLFELTLTDPLTKLYNRRHLIERLATLSTVKRDLTVMVFDIDDFKSINDQFGHLAGDQAIVAVANTAKSVTDEKVTLARIGGEEFALVSVSLSAEEAQTLACEICTYVNQMPIPLDGQNIHVSISLGCAYYPKFDETPSLQDADQLMYRGKASGKNRAVFQIINRNKVEPLLRKAQ